jgi:hypothetical protein
LKVGKWNQDMRIACMTAILSASSDQDNVIA